jgi:hypothetical protein
VGGAGGGDRVVPWIPKHKTSKGKVFDLAGPRIRECPVSYITGESRALVNILLQGQMAKEASGAALFGPDLSRWPAKVHDAMVILAGEESKLQDARMDAEKER